MNDLTDKEILEFSAKSIGVSLWNMTYMDSQNDLYGDGLKWGPLTDSSDTALLMVRLKMLVNVTPEGVSCIAGQVAFKVATSQNPLSDFRRAVATTAALHYVGVGPYVTVKDGK
jgi:hypothetical protein